MREEGACGEAPGCVATPGAGGQAPVRPRVLAVVGPTASGKSALADELACRLGSPVVSADAMQIYRRMDIGTAKTPPQERRAPLLCIDLAEPSEAFSVACYMGQAHAAIDAAVAAGQVPVVCGGTGLYVRAALEDMDFPAGEQLENPVRQRYEHLAEELGPDGLHALLAQRDPASAALIHPNNVRRVVRAFELLEQGMSYARQHEGLHVRTDRLPTLMVGLDIERSELYARIDERVEHMVDGGLVEEVRGLVDEGLAASLTSRQAIGYREIIAYLQGDCSLGQAVEDIQRATRRYAKRQLTWFRADPRVRWIATAGRTVDQMADVVEAWMDAGAAVGECSAPACQREGGGACAC